jgi:hypothetical protein
MSSDTYTKREVAEVEHELLQVDEQLSTKVTTPITLGYCPELDVTNELDPKRANYYQGLIGLLRRITVAPASLGHLEEAF